MISARVFGRPFGEATQIAITTKAAILRRAPGNVRVLMVFFAADNYVIAQTGLLGIKGACS